MFGSCSKQNQQAIAAKFLKAIKLFDHQKIVQARKNSRNVKQYSYQTSSNKRRRQPQIYPGRRTQSNTDLGETILQDLNRAGNPQIVYDILSHSVKRSHIPTLSHFIAGLKRLREFNSGQHKSQVVQSLDKHLLKIAQNERNSPETLVQVLMLLSQIGQLPEASTWAILHRVSNEDLTGRQHVFVALLNALCVVNRQFKNDPHVYDASMLDSLIVKTILAFAESASFATPTQIAKFLEAAATLQCQRVQRGTYYQIACAASRLKYATSTDLARTLQALVALSVHEKSLLITLAKQIDHQGGSFDALATALYALSNLENSSFIPNKLLESLQEQCFLDLQFAQPKHASRCLHACSKLGIPLTENQLRKLVSMVLYNRRGGAAVGPAIYSDFMPILGCALTLQRLHQQVTCTGNVLMLSAEAQESEGVLLELFGEIMDAYCQRLVTLKSCGLPPPAAQKTIQLLHVCAQMRLVDLKMFGGLLRVVERQVWTGREGSDRASVQELDRRLRREDARQLLAVIASYGGWKGMAQGVLDMFCSSMQYYTSSQVCSIVHSAAVLRLITPYVQSMITQYIVSWTDEQIELVKEEEWVQLVGAALSTGFHVDLQTCAPDVWRVAAGAWSAAQTTQRMNHLSVSVQFAQVVASMVERGGVGGVCVMARDATVANGLVTVGVSLTGAKSAWLQLACGKMVGYGQGLGQRQAQVTGGEGVDGRDKDQHEQDQHAVGAGGGGGAALRDDGAGVNQSQQRHQQHDGRDGARSDSVQSALHDLTAEYSIQHSGSDKLGDQQSRVDSATSTEDLVADISTGSTDISTVSASSTVDDEGVSVQPASGTSGSAAAVSTQCADGDSDGDAVVAAIPNTASTTPLPHTQLQHEAAEQTTSYSEPVKIALELYERGMYGTGRVSGDSSLQSSHSAGQQCRPYGAQVKPVLLGRGGLRGTILEEHGYIVARVPYSLWITARTHQQKCDVVRYALSRALQNTESE